MAIHHELAELVERAGNGVLDTIESFRAACDDYIPESAATRGEWNLLGDAIRLGELQRFVAQLDNGADPTTAVEMHGTRLAAERGTSEAGGARWALASLGYAMGRVSEEEVLSRHAEMTRSVVPPAQHSFESEFSSRAEAPPPAPAAPTLVPRGSAPTQAAPDAVRGTGRQESSGERGVGAEQDAPQRRGRTILVALVVAAAIAVAAASGALLLDNDEPSPSNHDAETTNAPKSNETSSAVTDSPQQESEHTRDEVLAFAQRAAKVMFERNFRTYDRDAENALEVMTEAMAENYAATVEDVRDDFIRARTSVEVRVVASGTTSMGVDGAAQVLVFINQYVFRGQNQGAKTTYTPYRVVLNLVNQDAKLLVDEIATDPDSSFLRPEPDPVSAEILTAAETMVLEFLNVDYRTISNDIAGVLALATGPFERQYQRTSSDLSELTMRAHAVQTGEIVAAGIAGTDERTATVIVATRGTVSNDSTNGEPADRTYRLQLRLKLADGRWLTEDLQYVR